MIALILKNYVSRGSFGMLVDYKTM